MSYTRSKTATISVPYSGSVTVSYGPSQSGGSRTVSYSGVVHEHVTVNVYVDTNNFDASIQQCNNNVGILTGAVVATNAAQVKAIKDNAKKVGNSIINGFFKYISSDMSQQIAELTQVVETHLVHLNELAKNCKALKKQMEKDYNHITSRYLKIFDELNHELENRVHELDRPSFAMDNLYIGNQQRKTGNDVLGTVLVSGGEESDLQSKISVSAVKKRALDSINKAKLFIHKQNKTQYTISHCMLNDNTDKNIYFPVFVVETKDTTVNRNTYQPQLLSNQSRTIASYVDNNKIVNNSDWGEVKRYFNIEMKQNMSA